MTIHELDKSVEMMEDVVVVNPENRWYAGVTPASVGDLVADMSRREYPAFDDGWWQHSPPTAT